ncbi:MAG: phosphotransferase, partial [Planctomycetota bacterium]
FKSLSEVEAREQQVSIAEEAGRGLAQYGDFTASVDVSQLVSPLPGYRETDVYFDQFQSVLKGSRDLAEAQPFLPKVPTLRQSTQRHFYLHLDDKEFQRRIGDPELQHFIQLVEREREFGMTLVDSRRSGRIRTVAIHGDTKLDNFLFSTRSGQAKALVDLDTIMPNTWLADWGDMSRSLTNVAGEKERDLARVQVDMEIYEALVRGFLLTAEEVTKDEVALMVASVELITLELGVRFLADYLRGDSYFVLGPTDAPDLNKVRAMAQLTLFERLRDRAGDAQACVDRYLAERRVQ